MHGECCHDFLFDAKSHPASEKHNFVYEKGSHYLTDGKLKYIWYVTSGKEQLFDIVNDYQEACDLSGNPAYAKKLEEFRQVLVKQLAGREEGFSDGERLIAGKDPVKVNAAMQTLADQRQREGFTLAFGRRRSPLDNLQYENTLLN